MYPPKQGTREHRNREQKRGIHGEFPCFWENGELPANSGEPRSREYATKSGCTFLNGAMIKMLSNMMKVIALSTTKSELNAAVLESMDMMLAYYILKGMKLTVELPMKLYVDNSNTTLKDTSRTSVSRVVILGL